MDGVDVMDELQSALEAAQLEKSLHPNETPEQMSRRILHENQLAAVQSMMDLAYHARSDRLRWKATKELLDGEWTVDGAIRIRMNDGGEMEEA